MPGSIYQIEHGKLLNIAPVIDPAGAVVARYRKMFPFRPYEEGVLPIAGTGTLGVSICYDLWFPETTRSLVWMGAEVLICPTLTNTVDRNVELAMARATAAGNQCYVVSVNSGAPMGMGRSIVCGPGGEVIHQAGAGYEVFAFDIDFDLVARVRREGWQVLGQPLKSFRDNTVKFPPYQAAAISPGLNDLGPVAKRNSKKPPTRMQS
jgi:predicted amidohydrolase